MQQEHLAGPRLTRWAMRQPRSVFAITLAVAVIALAAFSRLKVDTDPENMLPPDQADRVFHELAKTRFDLRDALVVGLVADGPEGIYTPQALSRIHTLTRAILQIEGVVQKDVLSLATVDDVRSDGPGTVRFSWLMSSAVASPERAQAVREAVARIPMFQGSLVSEDGHAAAIHVPIVDKSESHRIAEEIRQRVAQLAGGERYFITGLPVAEDTFGVEMFVQMAISAPLAALVIVLMLWLFFRSGALIAAPMLLAMASVVTTMGALIGSGFPVHIMSSMIPIFLMPIAVVDSVHVLSEFKDRLAGVGDAKRTMGQVMVTLYRPMLFTSLTSAAGFASLALTPIPPVRVFGLFVAFGILLAFLLTITLLPAYVARLEPARLTTLLGGAATVANSSALSRGLRRLGLFASARRTHVIAGAGALSVVAVLGIQRIQINDNPVRWFTPQHPIRVADRVLNSHFAGTYRTYLVLEAPQVAGPWLASLDDAVHPILEAASPDVRSTWGALTDGKASPEVVAAGLLAAQDLAPDPDYGAYGALLESVESVETRRRTFEQPTVLNAMAELQDDLVEQGLVGKATSLADVVKTVHRALRDGDPQGYRVPDSARGVGQVLVSYRSSHRPDDLSHLVTSDARSAVIWLQHRSGDNLDVSAVTEHVDRYLLDNPLPLGVRVRWAGLPYINVVWQGLMVEGMAKALLGSFAIVLFMMVLLFRSLRYGVLAVLPLALTVSVIYGLLGLLGKDYDMPVAVLSSLALGLSVDFAIHFIERARALQAGELGRAAVVSALFEEPARAIARNLIVIAVGFLPLLFAPLVPYVTVGILMASIMLLSGLVTLVLLPALLPGMAARRSPTPVPAPKQLQPEGSNG